ncbi:MAG: HAMP domain-containing histidine kinase [Pirellulales bacterium]|nr:HAMP domain-containing histidine kinase [Pirellulales bacterium]
MARRKSIGWSITLGVVMIVLVVALAVGWVLLTIPRADNPGLYITALAVGLTLLVLVLVGVVLYLTITVKVIALGQRQSNFIDSVTHELKSPIASLKLHLQTLKRRELTEDQRERFYGVMLDDLERLDTLINHMLDAARIEQTREDDERQQVDLADVLRTSAETACNRYHVPQDVVTLDLEPAVVYARLLDVEMVFRNLIDNAIKYSGDPPAVEVSCSNGDGMIKTRISDNGPGIPVKYRSKVFARFVRLGSELERSKTGTGLGLYIVRTAVRRMRGKVNIRSRSSGKSGTVFEVELPAHAKTNDEG